MLLVANLDCEYEMARAEGHRGGPLPDSAKRTASALGTLMRVLAEPADRLWTILPVDPARIPTTPDLPRPRLVSGNIPDGETLRWGVNGEIERRANDREFSLRLAEAHGWSLAGSAVVHSLWAAERMVADGERFVLKQPLSAAGRSRLIGERRSDVARAARFLNEQDRIVFEPWVERIEDYSATGFVGADGVRDLEVHRLLSDDVGRFEGIAIDDRFEAPAAITRAAHVAGEALCAEGYRGPFSVDSFSYRDREGNEALCPLIEINARWTFGLLARRFARRLGLSRMTLRTGHELPEGGTPLLLPGDEDRTVAWLEID
jgi:hypothetical protein